MLRDVGAARSTVLDAGFSELCRIGFAWRRTLPRGQCALSTCDYLPTKAGLDVAARLPSGMTYR
jgi:hypothetical protein